MPLNARDKHDFGVIGLGLYLLAVVLILWMYVDQGGLAGLVSLVIALAVLFATLCGALGAGYEHEDDQ